MSAVGELALWAALACAAWGIVAAGIALRRHDDRFSESAMRAGIACAVLLALADAGLTAMLLSADVRYAYAAATTSAVLPRAYRLAAFLSRPAGSLLGFAALTAVIAAISPRTVRERARVSLATCGLLALAIVAMLAIGSPFAPASVVASDGVGLDPAWHLPWTTIARLALLAFASVLAIAKIRALGGVPWRRWVYAANALGFVAIVCARRRELAGPPWDTADWLLLAVWAVSVAFRRRERGRTARALEIAFGVAGVVALIGSALSLTEAFSLPDGAPVSARDPFGSAWTLVSDGRSIYTQLDRRVLAVFIETGHGRGARPEWRIYVDASGDARAQVPVDAVLAGAREYLALGLLAPPAAGSASVRVRWEPFFAFWWLAAALLVAAAVVRAREPGAP